MVGEVNVRLLVCFGVEKVYFNRHQSRPGDSWGNRSQETAV